MKKCSGFHQGIITWCCFIHETTRSPSCKTLECIKIQRCAEMWNCEVQGICTKARGKLYLLFEACCMRTLKKMHSILGLKAIFARLKKVYEKTRNETSALLRLRNCKKAKKYNSMRALMFFESLGRILHL